MSAVKPIYFYAVSVSEEGLSELQTGEYIALSSLDPLLAQMFDGNSQIKSSYLPSYVDDVIESANYAALPATGETGKIYVTLDTNYQYRWSGSTYIQITNGAIASTSNVPEGSNLYFTNAHAIAATLTSYSANAYIVSGLNYAISGANAITSTDTILTAIQKLDGIKQNKIRIRKADGSVGQMGI